MAAVNFLHWNIETLGNNKINLGNGPHIINYIAAVANNVNANMISIIEVKASAAANLTANLVPALFALKNNGNPWSAVVSTVTPNAEAYYLLWEHNNNFITLPSALAPGPNPNQAFPSLNGFPPPVNLAFPSPVGGAGGRRPYVATFQTTDTGNNFSVLMYHAMFGGFTSLGVVRMGLLDAITQLDDGTGNLVPMQATIVAGDFNIDWLVFPGDYANLIANVGQPATSVYMVPAHEKTSLVNSTPPVPFVNPLDYRVHAYDNIFGRNAAYANEEVTDLIVESTTLPPPNAPGALVPAITNFTVPPIRNNGLLNNAPPPQDYEDAWHVVRDQVSNHLPVSVSLTI